MTNIDAAAAVDIEVWRAALSGRDWWSTPWSELSDLIVLPNGTQLSDDVWQSPNGWTERRRRLDFNKALPTNWRREEPRAEALLRRLKRLAAIDFTMTIRGGKRGGKTKGILRPGCWETWATRSNSLFAAAKAVAEMTCVSTPTRCPDGIPLFAALSPAALNSALPAYAKDHSSLVSRMNALFAAGVIDDWPSIDVAYGWRNLRIGNSNLTQPFSDQSFTILGRAAFAVAALQDDLLSCYQEIAAIKTDENGRCRPECRDDHRQSRLASWSGTRLRPGTPLGVTLSLIERTGTHQRGNQYIRNEQFDAWPFRTYEQVLWALSLCQTANWIILAAATGARAGEIEALTRNTLIEFVPARWGGEDRELALVTGKTFKTEIVGVDRQWPLPIQAVEAFKRQLRLSSIMQPEGKSLWMSRRGKVFMHDRIKFFCQAVSLDGIRTIRSVIDGRVHAQRFRETLSRLVGLCLDNGHHVLFDVLGHREMDTTIGYMMSDPDFAAQARRVKWEAEAVRKRRIIGNADVMLGPAAKEIVRLRNTVAKQVHGTRIDLDNSGSADVAAHVAEFAEIMSDEEMDTILPRATIVRPGIYCVANEAQPGLCSKSTVRDVSRCNPFCHHRLEEAAANDDRRRSIRYILEKTNALTTTCLQRAFYQRQLLDQFGAAPVLVDEFLKDPRLCAALADIALSRLAMLPDGLREKLATLLEKEP